MTLSFSYKNSTDADTGYLFLAGAQDYGRFLTDRYEPLPGLKEGNSVNFLSDYNDTVHQCLKFNRDNKFFSMTPFAMRNTWQSSFYIGAENYARLSQLQSGHVYFYSPEWFLWACDHIKAEVQRHDMIRAQLDVCRLPAYRLSMIYQGLRFALSRKVTRQKIPQNLKFVISSIWTIAGRKLWEQQGREPFYADLPQAIKKHGREIAVVYHDEGAMGDTNAAGPVPAFNFTSLLRFWDWLALARQLAFFRIKLPPQSKFPAVAIYRDISQSLSNQVPLVVISYLAAINLIQGSPKVDFLALYEGNCWEQGVLQAAHERGRSVIGYQHTSFAPASLKIDCHSEDKGMPDKVITSGAEPARLLADVFGHKPEFVVAGCSLRHTFPGAPWPSTGRKILVLLQGAPDDALLLHLLARHLDVQDVVVRSHPSCPIAEKTSFTMSDQDLQSDLAQARIVLYTGTTAAFEALSAGIAVIHIDLGGPLSADPLFSLKDCAVKKTWSRDTDLKRLIMQLDTLSDEERKVAFDVALRYVQHYFSSADDSILKQVVHG
jgi:hypothetical protein